MAKQLLLGGTLVGGKLAGWGNDSSSTYDILFLIIWLTDFMCCDWSIPGP